MTQTPRTLEILQRGLASMKAAGLDNNKVYDACAAFTGELGKLSIELEQSVVELTRQLAEAQQECNEQARLNGIGSEREAALMARLAERDKENGLLRLTLEQKKTLLESAEQALAERDRQLAEAQRDVPEGCTVADARILREANHELAQIEHRLRLALRFYANGYHMDLSGNPDAWDTVSGEPANYFCDEAGSATIEDGTIAKLALLDGPMDWTGEDGEDQTPPPISGESEHQIAIDAAIQEQKK